jgi:hypothetical protein
LGSTGKHFRRYGGARWHPTRRTKCKNDEEAEKILMETGRMARPLRLENVSKLMTKRTIVANELERRRMAERAAVHHITKLASQMIIRREVHPVWHHDRIVVYAKMRADYLLPDYDTGDPLSRGFDLKFKAAFRENLDPNLPTDARVLQKELERRGISPDFQEAKLLESLLKSNGALEHHEDNLVDNFWSTCILDNVVDLGELVAQHFIAHVDRYPTERNAKKLNKYSRRMSKRIKADWGLDYDLPTWADKDIEAIPDYHPQGAHDYAVQKQKDMNTAPKPNFQVRSI